jgi:catechol 2,3-dioxygenase-like lactoylglutathione lyase family enzyme
MLGRFLEVSIYAPDIQASVAFYESLGFVQARVGDTWPHPYAVVTDGRLFLGLHQYRFDSPSLTFVRPGIVQHASTLEQLGIDFAFAKLQEDDFHELGFLDPSGQMITILEARTFSPPSTDGLTGSQLGYFEEFGIPTTDLEQASQFWDRLGLVAFEPERVPFTKVVAVGSDLNVGLYDLDLRFPVLTFSDPQMRERLTALREKGYAFMERLPRGLRAGQQAILLAPEGTALMLTTARD